ncbi:hypothetical protein SAMN00768000_1984 [Sulfobacillus thermosulfidooxidans DSM 9293]|uniref:Uncharacterized protein n=1 Tax=Sulfobacillus thermosulfidooxidans (strain DSM 9293 / VKM B-1269 / AT-1) TaxID=929705 RepID=A0A1W1WG51_SULTA|nr:hypothetical protein [Sulfobacillus thermosulfidooxidans]SMC05030.1 hypothetical protein SAMN00768000_1984 [Sulfobacillus thermosulfidooxidans DSM 9293]
MTRILALRPIAIVPVILSTVLTACGSISAANVDVSPASFPAATSWVQQHVGGSHVTFIGSGEGPQHQLLSVWMITVPTTLKSGAYTRHFSSNTFLGLSIEATHPNFLGSIFYRQGDVGPWKKLPVHQ